MLLKILIIPALFYCAHSQNVDMTLVAEASGTAVVFATVSRIQQAKIFPDDQRLLRRVAYAETRDGTDSDTYRSGYNGGIWQVDEDIFEETVDVTAQADLRNLYDGIFVAFAINWTEVQWMQLRAPLFSALAARIYFEIVQEDIPNIGDLEGQGQFWKRHYNSNPEDTVQFFVSDVDTLELEECPARGIDLTFVFDSSGSVGRDNFELEKEFAINVAQTFSIGPSQTQIAAVAFSGFARISFFLNTYNNQSSIVRALRDIEYFDIAVTVGNRRTSTNTADALIRTQQEIFTSSGGARDQSLGYPRVAVVVTDGRSNINSSLTIPSAETLHEARVTVFAVGVGRNINMDELNGIASSESFVILLSQFNLMEFVGLQRRISTEACIIPAFIPIEQPIESMLDGGEVIFFQFQLPSNGMTIQLQREQGRVTLYGSFDIQNPNSAFHSFKIESSGRMFVAPEDAQPSSENQRRLRRTTDSGNSAQYSSTTLFVSIEGEEDSSFFTLDTTFGDTSRAPTRHMTLGLVVLSTVVAVIF